MMMRIGASYFFCFVIFGIMVPLLSPVLLEMGYSKSAVGLIQAAIYFTSVVIPILGGRLSDLYFSQDRLIRITAWVMSLAALLMWLISGHPSWLFVTALITLAAARAPQVPLQDALAMQTAGSHPGQFAKMRQAGSFGFAIAAILMGYFSQTWGLKVFFPAMVCATLLYSLNSFFLPPEQKSDVAIEKKAFWMELNHTWWMWLAALFCHWLSFAPYHYGFTILLTEADVPLSITGWMWAVGVAAEIGFFLGSNWFFNKLGFRGVLVLAFSANLIRWSLIGLFPSGTVIGLTQILHGPGFALYYAAVLQGIHHYCGGKQRASYQGLYTTIVSGGSSIIGMLLCGKLYEMFSLTQETASMSKVFFAMVPIQLLGLILLVTNHLKPPKPRQKTQAA